MKKQFYIAVLLLSLVAPAIVTYSWMNYRKHQVKKEVKRKIIAGISKNELVVLKYSKKQVEKKLKWKHSKEFEYNHQMYDVVERKVANDSITYWCWWDNEETKLNQELIKLASRVFQNDLPTKEKQTQVVTFYKSLFFQEIEYWQPFCYKKIVHENYFVVNHFKTLSLKLELPPPRKFHYI